MFDRPTANKYDNCDVIQLSNNNIKNNRVTHKSFKEKYGLVKVYAPWCGYCNQMEDDMKFLARELKREGIAIGALNYEQNKETCQSLGVSSFPSLYMVGNGGKLESVDLNDRSVESMLQLICNKTNEYSQNRNGKCCKRVNGKIVC